MALYHLSLKKISRSKGNATNAISYITASYLTDIYDGMTYDHRRKQYVDDTMIILPENAPEAWNNLQTLTDAINQSSSQPQATLCREIEFSLPRELSKEKQSRIAMEYIQENFVDDGMAAIVAFHSPKKSDDEESSNPHVHVIITAKPIDNNGHWISKTVKKYVCENESGQSQLMSVEELKKNPSYEKIYHYRSENGNTSWHTKSYAMAHPDECSEQITRYPKASQVQHPLIAKWADPLTLDAWRKAWAIKQNETFEALGLDIRVDHRSYKRQGLDIIPMIHEGPEITALELKYEEEYQQKLSQGIDAIPRHTEIRELNIAIHEHNEEIKIVMELKKLKQKMEGILKPVVERLEDIGHTIAEKLEKLRIGIVLNRIKKQESVELLAEAEEKNKNNELYIHDLSPVQEEKIVSLSKELKNEKQKLQTGHLSKSERKEKEENIEYLENAISLYTENRKLALNAENEIDSLKKQNITLKDNIKKYENVISAYWEKYNKMMMNPSVNAEELQQERLRIRPALEDQYVPEEQKIVFKNESQRMDAEFGMKLKEDNQLKLKAKKIKME